MRISGWSSDVCSSDLVAEEYAAIDQRLTLEDALDIVDIDAGADDPAPGRKAFHIGNLRHRPVGAGLGPEIRDKAGTVALDRLDEFDEQVLAVRILDFAEILADNLLGDRNGVVLGKGVLCSLDLGWCRIIKKKNTVT